MSLTAEEIKDVATAVRSELISEMERKGMIWFPKKLAKQRSEEIALESLQKKFLRERALTYRQISDAQLWGEIDPQAVRAYAVKYAKENEIFPSSKGKRKEYKIITAAVVRLRKKRGYATL